MIGFFSIIRKIGTIVSGSNCTMLLCPLSMEQTYVHLLGMAGWCTVTSGVMVLALLAHHQVYIFS